MSTGSRLRDNVLAAREQLHAGREDIRTRHQQGLPSVQVCAKLTTLVDRVVIDLFDATLNDMPRDVSDNIRKSVALVAHGGYGRRHLAPHSDIDLMILDRGTDPVVMQDFVTRLTQDIYDCGLQLGHSLRSPTDAIALARTDPIICSSLVESRIVGGSQDLFSVYWKNFRAMVDRRQTTLVREFIAARRTERHKYGETVFLLEPNVKRSRGGLRDVHLLRWMWFTKTGLSDPDKLLGKGVLSKFDHHRLRTARDFLLMIRNHIHFNSKSGTDLLTRATQVEIAEALHYRGRDGLRPVEQFMREYFRHSAHVSFLANRLVELMSPARGVGQFFAPMLSRSPTRDYRITSNEIGVSQNGVTKLKSRLEEAIRLVKLSGQHDCRIAQDTWYMVYRAAPNYSGELNEAAVERFRALLDDPKNLGESLRRLRDLGVLERIIPPFAHARGLLQFNQYHKYTVDEHCIRAVEEGTKLQDRNDYAAECYKRLKNKFLLHLALLIHDLGKGHEEDHSVLGEQIAEEMAERLRLEVSEQVALKYLVRNHLSLAHAAFRRDTSDQTLLNQFAGDLGSVEWLDMLYLLTCADLAAVGPGVLNAWKVSMLTDLRNKIEAAMAPGESYFEQSGRETIRQQVWQQLAQQHREDPWFAEQFAELNESFLTEHNPREIATVLSQLRALQPRQGTAWGRYQEQSNTVVFTAGVDQGTGRGVFSAMAGVLASCGMRILSAETVGLAHGLLLLRYVAEEDRTSDGHNSARIADLAQQMVAAIDTDCPPKFRRLWGQQHSEAAASLSDLPNEVRIDTNLSADCAIVEVFTFDRLGLLYHLARALHELNLNIRFAKIGTYLDQVVDVFYVTERDGTKPESDARLLEIREALQPIIEAEG